MFLHCVYRLWAYEFYFFVYNLESQCIQNPKGQGDRTAHVKLYDIVKLLYGNLDIGIIAAKYGRHGPNVN